MLIISHAEAASVLRDEAARASTDPGPAPWREKVVKLSALCTEGKAITHIAFLGTILLARSVDRNADVKWIKPTHSQGAPNAFSARPLSEKVLVPIAAELGIHIGATGPQPLNNQPYFRMSFLGDATPVHRKARPAFDYMLSLVKEIEAMPDEATAREALRAFISVRRRHQPIYAPATGDGTVSRERLVRSVRKFVGEGSEGGKRAQAVVAGLFDVVFGNERVVTDRINSPSRRYPGDVCVINEPGGLIFEKSIEVKDKPVTSTDVQIFCRKCLEFNAHETAYMMMAASQKNLDLQSLYEWAEASGVTLTIYSNWGQIVRECLFWGSIPSTEASSQAYERIRERLISIEAAPASVARWDELAQGANELAAI
jgi:hypothetical protein